MNALSVSKSRECSLCIPTRTPQKSPASDNSHGTNFFGGWWSGDKHDHNPRRGGTSARLRSDRLASPKLVPEIRVSERQTLD
jgi:hypothetical protein